MVKVTCLLAKAGSGVGLSFGVRALTQMEIRCVKGMFRLKLISSEKNSVFKGLICQLCILHCCQIYHFVLAHGSKMNLIAALSAIASIWFLHIDLTANL